MHASEAALLGGTWVYSIFQFFRRLGAPGLLLLSTLDSSFLFIPLGNDLVLIALIAANRGGLKWILYVTACSAGSMLGVLLVDLLMRTAGEAGLKEFLSRNNIKRLKYYLEKRADGAVFAATLMPPPFPFTVVIMAAAALQYSRKRLLGLVLLGRLMRFSLEALLAIYFGDRLLLYLNSKPLEYFVYGLVVVAAVGSTLSLIRWVRSRSHS